MAKDQRPKLADLAARIAVHLDRFERDTIINFPRNRLRPYWRSGAGVAGRYVHVVYVSFQGGTNLTREEAERYLAWLDAGNVGTHWSVPKALGEEK